MLVVGTKLSCCARWPKGIGGMAQMHRHQWRQYNERWPCWPAEKAHRRQRPRHETVIHRKTCPASMWALASLRCGVFLGTVTAYGEERKCGAGRPRPRMLIPAALSASPLAMARWRTSTAVKKAGAELARKAPICRRPIIPPASMAPLAFNDS